MTLVTPHSCDNFNYFFTVKLNRTQTLASQSHRMKAYIFFYKICIISYYFQLDGKYFHNNNIFFIGEWPKFK